MEELYQMIEDKIRKSGFKKEIDGRKIYTELCDLIEEKENGTYILLSKNHEDDIYEYNITVMDDNFNLSSLNITSQGEQYHINFDED